MSKEALKLALEVLETELAVDMTNGAEVGEAAELMCEAIKALKEALKQEQGEPVAWMDADGNVSDNNDYKCFPIPLYTTPPPCPTCEALARTVMLDQTSHDTTPQQRPWVELTEEERDAITDKVIGFNSCCGWEDDYAKAIEAKIKEKNQ